MKFREVMAVAFGAIWAHKLRSFLTLLGGGLILAGVVLAARRAG